MGSCCSQGATGRIGGWTSPFSTGPEPSSGRRGSSTPTARTRSPATGSSWHFWAAGGEQPSPGSRTCTYFSHDPWRPRAWRSSMWTPPVLPVTGRVRNPQDGSRRCEADCLDDPCGGIPPHRPELPYSRGTSGGGACSPGGRRHPCRSPARAASGSCTDLAGSRIGVAGQCWRTAPSVVDSPAEHSSRGGLLHGRSLAGRPGVLPSSSRGRRCARHGASEAGMQDPSVPPPLHGLWGAVRRRRRVRLRPGSNRCSHPPTEVAVGGAGIRRDSGLLPPWRGPRRGAGRRGPASRRR